MQFCLVTDYSITKRINHSVQFLEPVHHANFPQATVLKYLPSLSRSRSLSLGLSICVYAYAGKKGSTLSHGPRARGLKLDPEWPTLPIETSLQFSHWDPVTLPKIVRHLNEKLLNWQRTVQDKFNKTTVPTDKLSQVQELRDAWNDVFTCWI